MKLLILSIVVILTSCSPKINVQGIAYQKHQGIDVVTTSFKTKAGEIFVKRGFKYGQYELGMVYSFNIKSRFVYTEIR